MWVLILGCSNWIMKLFLFIVAFVENMVIYSKDAQGIGLENLSHHSLGAMLLKWIKGKSVLLTRLALLMALYRLRLGIGTGVKRGLLKIGRMIPLTDLRSWMSSVNQK